MLIQDNTIDLEFRRNQLIALTMDENLQLCAEGCFSRFATAAQSLRSYVDLKFSKLMEKFVVYLAEKIMNEGPLGADISYTELLCKNTQVTLDDYQIHAKNYLLNRLLSELQIKSLIIKDVHSNYFETYPDSDSRAVEKIHLNFSKMLKKKLRASHLIKFILNQYYQKENIQFSEGKFLSSKELDIEALEIFLKTLGEDSGFNLHEVVIFDKDTKKIF